MDDGSAPRGQMELRLEACQDAGLTDLAVDPDSTVTARWAYSDDGYYMFTISPGSEGRPAFAWHEVTASYFRMETYPDTIETFRTENEGPSLGLPEMLAMDEADSPLPTFWREAATALMGIYEMVSEDIQECIEEAASEASRAASERLTERFQQPAGAPPFPDVRECFAAFETACLQRAQYCGAILMGWDQDFDGPPEVEFGIAVNTPWQVLYKVDSDGGLYLNGFWTAKHRLEDDLMEQFPNDAWARLGARNAARDLLEIQRTGQELMDAQKQDILQDMDRQLSEDQLDSIAQGLPLRSDWRDSETPIWRWHCDRLWERIKEYLTGLKPQRRIQPDEYDIVL